MVLGVGSGIAWGIYDAMNPAVILSEGSSEFTITAVDDMGKHHSVRVSAADNPNIWTWASVTKHSMSDADIGTRLGTFKWVQWQRRDGSTYYTITDLRVPTGQ